MSLVAIKHAKAFLATLVVDGTITEAEARKQLRQEMGLSPIKAA